MGMIPPYWTVCNGGSSPDTWYGTMDFEGETLDGTPFAFVWDPMGMNLMEEELWSPPVPAEGYPIVTLEFDHYFHSDAGVAMGEVWVWDGLAWLNVYGVYSEAGWWGVPDHVVIDLSPYANPGLIVDFYYYDDMLGDPYDSWWALDNVLIEGDLEPEETIVYGTVVDPEGVAIPIEDMYIQAHPWCHPWDTLSVHDGTIQYWIDGGVGNFQLDYTQFLHPCGAGDWVNLFFLDDDEALPLAWDEGVAVCVDGANPVEHNVELKWDKRYEFQAWATEEISITVPAGKTATVVMGDVDYEGSFSVKTWNSDSCKYVVTDNWPYKDGSTHNISGGTWGRTYKIHNNDDDVYGIRLDVVQTNRGGLTREERTFTAPAVSLGGKDGFNCDFGDIVAPAYFYDYEMGCCTGTFPQVLGPAGVNYLEVEFDSYDNVYWWDLRLQIDLIDVSFGGTLILEIPDADIPVSTIMIAPGDDACFLYPGGIWEPGAHSMYLFTLGGLSFDVDCFNFTSNLNSVGELDIQYESDLVILSWDDPYADPPDVYRVFSSDEPYSGFSLLGTTPLQSYEDLVLDRAKQFYLVLRSLDQLP